jgi:aspartyl-tRNA(Asn)/glutamyl-tRNA(Gln) amidotransferase subunit A
MCEHRAMTGADRAGIFLATPDDPPEGVRLAVKDLFDTAGLTTTYGSVIFRDHVPERTAAAVTLLERAGYANVGKTNLHEFAYGITSENAHFGTVPNPIAPGRIAGGSSGGNAAALAAGLAEAALGSDSGGSIRIPSACCGTVGFKPTYGRVPLDGCFPLAPSFDHAGPMARDVAGCEQMMRALVPGLVTTTVDNLDAVTIGVAWTEFADPLVCARVEAAAALFPRRGRLELPFATETYSAFAREVAQVHADLWAEHRDSYSPDLASKVGRAMGVTDADYEAAVLARERYREHMAELTAAFDLILTPTLSRVAPPTGIGDLKLRDELIRFTYPFNAIGAPALALPCGPADDGLPASVQLVGRPGADALVLAVGAALERALAHPEGPLGAAREAR